LVLAAWLVLHCRDDSSIVAPFPSPSV